MLNSRGNFTTMTLSETRQRLGIKEATHIRSYHELRREAQNALSECGGIRRLLSGMRAIRGRSPKLRDYLRALNDGYDQVRVNGDGTVTMREEDLLALVRAAQQVALTK